MKFAIQRVQRFNSCALVDQLGFYYYPHQQELSPVLAVSGKNMVTPRAEDGDSLTTLFLILAILL
jgi:hypothetical protein